MGAMFRWVITAAAVVVLAAGGLLFGMVLVVGGAAGESEVIYAADEEFCAGVPGPGPILGGTGHPMTGAYFPTDEYGWRIHPVLGIRVLHTGMDLVHTERDLPIAAVADGRVTRAFFDLVHGYGNVVDVDHGGGFVTRYAHLSVIHVEAGQSVAAGEHLGIEGTTGLSTGNHLHFETLFDGVAQDPRVWLTEQGHTMPPPGGGPVPASVPPVGPPGQNPARVVQAAVVGGGPAGPASQDLPEEIDGYRGEQLVNAGHIISAGLDRELDEWEITVAVMTAMGESSLINVDHGDEAGPDSRGLFQQRDSWGPEEDRMNPPVAAGMFYDALVQVAGYEELAPTIAAHRVQRNADPFHYAPHWASAGRVVAAILGDDDFLRDLPPYGDIPPGGCLPPGGTPGPIGECPASGSPAEVGLSTQTLHLLRCTYEAYPVPAMYGVGERPGPSDHPSGHAVDFALADYRSPEGNGYGWELSHWVVGNAQELDVKYVIFDMKIWTPTQGWEPYTRYGEDPDDTLAHRDHVHVSVNG